MRNSIQFSGLQIYKVGRTTAYTMGQIDQTCQTRPVETDQPTPTYLLCSFLVSGMPRPLGGDSGAPVFAPAFTQSGSPDNVRLAGVLYGYSPLLNRMAYSPIDAIEDDLGALTTQ